MRARHSCAASNRLRGSSWRRSCELPAISLRRGRRRLARISPRVLLTGRFAQGICPLFRRSRAGIRSFRDLHSAPSRAYRCAIVPAISPSPQEPQRRASLPSERAPEPPTLSPSRTRGLARIASHRKAHHCSTRRCFKTPLTPRPGRRIQSAQSTPDHDPPRACALRLSPRPALVPLTTALSSSPCAVNPSRLPSGWVRVWARTTCAVSRLSPSTLMRPS